MTDVAAGVVVVVAAVDGGEANGGAAAIAVDHVQEPSWDESDRFGPALEDLPDRVECSRADAAAEVGPVAVDWLPSGTAYFWPPTTETNLQTQAACRSYAQTLAALD